jgi:hypothetical protein
MCPGGNKKTSRYPQLARFCCLGVAPMPAQVSRRLGGGQNPQSPGPGNRLRPVVGTQLAIDVAGVGLDCVQSEEKPGSDFWIG